MRTGTTLATVLCLAVCLGEQVIAFQSPDQVLQVTVTAPPDSTGRVTAEVKNVSGRPVSAYALKWTAGAHSYVVTYEFFPSLGLEQLMAGQDTVGALQPWSTRKAGTQFSGFAPGTRASVAAVAAVFVGGSAIGDDETISKIFAARLAEAADLNRCLEATSKLDPSNGVQFFGALSNVQAPAGSELRRVIDEVRQRFSENADPELPNKFLKYLRARCAAAGTNSRRAQ